MRPQLNRRRAPVLAALPMLFLLASPAAEAETVTLEFEAHCLDLDAGEVSDPCPEPGSEESAWDVKIVYHAARGTHAVLHQNGRAGVELALLENSVYADVTAADAESAEFTTAPLDQSFGAGAVALVRTPAGVTFKLGNPSESAGGLTFDYQAL